MRFLRGGACIAYVGDSFIEVALATEDGVGSQSLPNACNTVKYKMYSRNHACQRFAVIDYNALLDESVERT